uniref:10 kDa chaperonin-like n=1 Tax=Nelumbo nucifera TaxID=4432 RepID=A0A822ZPS6_NELNU|nr:TPA_asm: hypothetical protein HUJ06_017179 [Nelumbo nucifera]
MQKQFSPRLYSGKVVAVGPGDRNRDGQLIPVGVKGDTVLLPEYGGTEVKLGEKSKYWIPSPLSDLNYTFFRKELPVSTEHL